MPSSSQTVIEQAAAQLLDQLKFSMFGGVIHNPFAEKGQRKEYHIHPYSKQGTGASATIIYRDARANQLYVLLSKKHNATQYDQIGGYTRGQRPSGGEFIAETRSSEEVDRQEEALIGNNLPEGKERDKEGPQKPYTVSYSLEDLQRPIHDYLIQLYAKTNGNLPKNFDAADVKTFLKTKYHIDLQNDYNTDETILREIQEETSLDLKHIKPRLLSCDDDFGISNTTRLHTKTSHYLFYLGSLDQPPPVKAGSDIAILQWAAVPDLQSPKESSQPCVTYNDTPIRLDYGLRTLRLAIKKARQIEIKASSTLKLALNSFPLFRKTKDIEGYIARKGGDVSTTLGSKPNSIYGKEVANYHQNALMFARKITDKKSEKMSKQHGETSGQKLGC